MARNMWVRVIKTEKLNEFLTFPYKIWNERNLRAPEVYVERDEFIYRCNRFVDDVVTANVSNKNRSPSMSRSILSWSRPPTGWIKGNSDGVVRTCDNMAAVGSVLRNSEGEWIFGFTLSLGRCLILTTELWGVHDLVACLETRNPIY
ncbi:uncharacterized protein LOC120184593 [Hibiscus syriacus]|uniref:uncharacterized protein LOC120184593 n=1 Tax=Hibiscus syriacus TaxID=106335 RepID=UPI001921D841|nr:uncharacterized protein LOC120184593 [Hibiscus syriacus]